MPADRRPDPSSHFGFLDEAETRARKKARRKGGDDEKDLDLDRIW